MRSLTALGDSPRRNQLIHWRNLDEEGTQRLRGLPDFDDPDPVGVLRQGWSAEVGDYAVAGGWTLAVKP